MPGTICKWQQLEWLPFLCMLLATSWGDLGGTATHTTQLWLTCSMQGLISKTICFTCVQFGFVTPELGRAMKILHHSARHRWNANCAWRLYKSRAVFKQTRRTRRLTCHCTAIQPAYHRVLVGPRSDADVPISWFEGQACRDGYCCQPLYPVHSAPDILHSSAW